jgi:hypothetical protein
VIHEAIITQVKEMMEAGLRPTHVRVGPLVVPVLQTEGALERHKIQGGWTRWVNAYYCKLKVVHDDRLSEHQFQVEGYKPHDEYSEARSVPSTPTRQLDEVSF